MLATVSKVRVLQKQRKQYDGNSRYYLLLGDGQSDVLKFRIDDAEVFEMQATEPVRPSNPSRLASS